MLLPALHVFTLRELPFKDYAFPRWQSAIAILALGLVIGLDPSLRIQRPGFPGMPLGIALAYGIISTTVAFLIVVAVLRWWLQRAQRWDGKGDLIKLSAASWLVPDLLGAGLVALGIPALLTLPLWLYSIWVGANAVSGAIPRVSLGYALTGLIIGLIPAMLTMILIGVASGIATASFGATR